MIKKRKEQITIEKVESKVCDICDRSAQDEQDDWTEFQEFVHVDFTGGYGSIFGDGARVSIDICQHCFKHMVGPHVRVNDEE